MPTENFFTGFQSSLSQAVFSSSLPMSLLLIGLEALIEHEFVCPCAHMCKWNVFATLLVIVIPPLFACALMYFYSTYFKTQNNVNEENRKKKTLHYLIPCVIWLFIMLLDGDYCACIFTCWKGMYVLDGKLNRKWCEPTGPERNDTKLKEIPERAIFWSQVNVK